MHSDNDIAAQEMEALEAIFGEDLTSKIVTKNAGTFVLTLNSLETIGPRMYIHFTSSR